MWVISFLILLISLVSFSYTNALNDRPIIGILAQETNHYYAQYGSSYITASYVKFLEGAGARVIPIMIHKPEKYYVDLLSNINGVLFPGGGVPLQSDGYGRSGRLIYNIAQKMNNRGDYFPLWGTCLGFELLNFLEAKKLWMKPCAANDLASNLNFVNDFKESKLFKNMDLTLQKIMQHENVTINYHHWCITPKNYTLSGLNKVFKILALNNDSRNTTYISIIEAYKYPFYGVAFHPEKVIYEWVLSKSHLHIPHSSEAIKVSQYFANFFVNEARKNNHYFPNKTMEDKFLIYNYNSTFTGKMNSSTVQNYYFL